MSCKLSLSLDNSKTDSEWHRLAVWQPATLSAGIGEGSSPRSLSNVPNMTSAYPSTPPMAATSLIAEVVLLWAFAFFGCCLCAYTTFNVGYVISASLCESVHGVYGVPELIQTKARDIAASSKQ